MDVNVLAVRKPEAAPDAEQKHACTEAQTLRLERAEDEAFQEDYESKWQRHCLLLGGGQLVQARGK
jgi:hypothetical protein